MTSVTGGNIQFTKRHKTGDYEHHDVVVNFNFSMPDNTPLSKAFEDAQIIGDQAKAKAIQWATGNAAAVPLRTITDRETVPPGPTQVNDKRRRGPNVKTPQTDVTEVPADPTAILDGVDPIKVAEADAKAPADDPLAITEDWAAPVEEVKTLTDAELTAKVTHVNGKIKNALAIRGVIAKYATSTPKSLAGIPAAARAAFVVELEKL